MSKTYTCFDLGSDSLKLAVCTEGSAKKIVVEKIPDNLVRDGAVISPEAMSDFIKQTAGKFHVANRPATVLLTPSVAFFERLSMPAMSIEQLEINLPYEFRDYITQEKEKYFYDYAVLDTVKDETGKPQTLDIMACAVLKTTIKDYAAMLRRGGFKLKIAAPEKYAYSNIIRDFERRNPLPERPVPDEEGGDAKPAERKYCIVDLGHSATRVYFYSGPSFDVVRVIEYGCGILDRVIADKLNVDEHIAATYKLTNYNDCLTDADCLAVYSNLAIEIMRAVNFYGFNYPGSNLTDMYYCGGGANIKPLIDIIAQSVSLELHGIEELMTHKDDNAELLRMCPAAIGLSLG